MGKKRTFGDDDSSGSDFDEVSSGSVSDGSFVKEIKTKAAKKTPKEQVAKPKKQTNKPTKPRKTPETKTKKKEPTEMNRKSSAAGSSKRKKKGAATSSTGGQGIGSVTSHFAKAIAAKQNGGTKTLKLKQSKVDEEAEKLQNQLLRKATRLKMLSKTDYEASSSKQVLSMNGPLAICEDAEIRMKKTTRQYLFMFPGKLSIQSLGTCGTLHNIGTNEPYLDLEFKDQQKTLRFLGKLAYGKNTYAQLVFDRKGKFVNFCEPFPELVVFDSFTWLDAAGKPTTPLDVKIEGMDIDWNDPPVMGNTYGNLTTAARSQSKRKPSTAKSKKRSVKYVSEDEDEISEIDSNSSVEGDFDDDEVVQPKTKRPRRSTSRQKLDFKKYYNDDDNDDDEDDEEQEEDRSTPKSSRSSGSGSGSRSKSARVPVVPIDDASDEDNNKSSEPAQDDDDDDDDEFEL